ncbi:MAG: YkgJ family cysteine cluster protein [Bacillota bacterium]
MRFFRTRREKLHLERPLDRGRAPGRGACTGCDRCCAERLPLTWIDCLNLKAAVAPEAGLADFLAAYAHVLVNGPAVDIILAAGADGSCCLLDRQNRTCRAYHARPLVCRTFICCPSTARARRLRAVLTNRGEDELVRQWLLDARRSRQPPLIHEGSSPRPRLGDWPPTPFAGCSSYREVTLKAVCPPGLWRALTAGSTFAH